MFLFVFFVWSSFIQPNPSGMYAANNFSANQVNPTNLSSS